MGWMNGPSNFQRACRMIPDRHVLQQWVRTTPAFAHFIKVAFRELNEFGNKEIFHLAPPAMHFDLVVAWAHLVGHMRERPR